MQKKLTHEEAHRIHQQSIRDYESALDLATPISYIEIPTILICLSILSYLIGRFRFSIFLLLVLIYTINHIFKRKYDKFKKSFQSKIYEMTRKEKARNCWESVEWLNYSIKNLWTVLEPMVSAETLISVNSFLYENCPPFLNKLRLTELTLGSAPPKILGVSFLDSSELNIIQIDTEVSFVPLETQRELFSLFFTTENKKQFNSRVCLSATLGSNKIGLDLPILVQNISFNVKTRLIITLVQTTLIKEIEITLLEMPKYDFVLNPLKAVDLMDLPGLSNWIRNIIKNNLEKSFINPMSLKINLEQFRQEKKSIGVAKVILLEYESRNAGNTTIEIDIDGIRQFTSSQRHGNSFLLNEYFYLHLNNKNELINFRNKNTEEKGNVLIERVLRNFDFYRDAESVDKSSDNRISESPNINSSVNNGINTPNTPNSKPTTLNNTPHVYLKDPIQIYTVKMKTKGVVTATLKIGVSFFEPIPPCGRTHLTNSALVKMNIIKIEEMQPLNYTKKDYVTSLSVFVSPERLEKKKEGVWLIDKTTNLIGSFFDLLGGRQKERLYESTPNTMYGHSTKTVVGSDSPKFNDECIFYSRSLLNDIIQIMVIDKNKQNANLTGNLEIFTKNIYNDQCEMFKIRDMQKGKMEIKFSLNYINEKILQNNLIFDKVVKIDLIEFSCVFGNGNYEISVFNNGSVYSFDSICGDLKMINRSILIPYRGNPKLKFDVFKENSREEDYMGSGELLIGEDSSADILIYNKRGILGKEANSVIALPFVESGRLNVKYSTKNLVPYKGLVDSEDQMRLINCRFKNFKNVKSEFRIELGDEDGLIGMKSVKGEEDAKFSFISGNKDIKILFKSCKIGSDVVFGTLKLPKMKFKDDVLLNESGFKCNLAVDVLTCDFKYKNELKVGNLQIRIVNVSDLQGNFPSTLIKVYLNNSQKLRTKIVEKSRNPTFNETVNLDINKMHDVVKISIHEFSESHSSKEFGVVETNLYFLQEGKFIHKFDFLQSNSTVPIGASVVCECVFSGSRNKKKSKNFLNSFLAM